MKPDKRTVDNLLNQINGERAEEVRAGGIRRIWFALPVAAVCLALCAAVFFKLNTNDIKPAEPAAENEQEAQSAQPEDDSSDEDGEWEDIMEDAEDIYALEEYHLYVECFAYEVEQETMDLQGIDEETEQDIFSHVESFEFFDETTYVPDEDDYWTSEQIGAYVGKARIRVGDTVYTAGLVRTWYSPSTERIGITFDGETVKAYVNKNYEINIVYSYVDFSTMESGEEIKDFESEKTELTDEASQKLHDEMLTRQTVYNHVQYNCKKIVDGESYADINLLGNGYFYTQYDDLGMQWLLWVYSIDDSEDLLVRFTDGVWFLFERYNPDASAVYLIDKLDETGMSMSVPDVALEISPEDKQKIIDEATEIQLEDTVYYSTYETANFPINAVCIASGWLTVENDTSYEVYVYRLDEDKIGVDILDGDLIVYEKSEK
jgi:hypothetical protein